MRKPGQIAVIVVFITVFTTPLVLFLLGVRPELDENRARTRFPSLQPRAMVDDDTYSQLESAYTDRLPFRDKAISFYASVQERSTFTDAVREGLPRGADGWLYHPDTLLDECLGPPPPVFLDRARQAFDATKAAGVPFYFIVPPDKISVYPDHLPTEGIAGVLGLRAPDVAECTALWRTALADAAPEQPWLLPLLPSLQSRSGDPDQRTYFKKDTHWTDFGALSQVQVTLDQLAPGMWDPNEVKRAADVSKVGDLTRLLGRPEEETAPGYEIVRPGVTVTQPRQPRGDITDDVNSIIVTRATSTDAPLIEGTTLFIADSFGRRSLSLMSPYFEELVFVSREYLADHAISDVLDTRPDRILIEQVQRNLAKEWYTQGLDATIDAMQLPA